MKQIVYLGYAVSPEEADRTVGASVAGNKMQWNILRELAKRPELKLATVTVTPCAAYPHSRNLFVRSRCESLFDGVRSYRVPFLNLPLIKQVWQILSVYRTACRVIKATQADTLFCFNLFPQIGVPMRWLKRRFPRLDTVCLLADLPIDDHPHRRGLSAYLRRRMEASTWRSMRACDRYIVLNRQVMERYLPGKPYTVMDGGVDAAEAARLSAPETVRKSGEHNLLFCGALTEYNGVLTLLQAMKLLSDTDMVLDIYGDGYEQETVRAAAAAERNIRYHGRVPNAEVLQKQREAWLLVNPRRVHDPIAEVTFPSKTFEYLLSGTPVLTTRLNGYGAEYDEVMFFADSDSAEGLAAALRAVRKRPADALAATAMRARQLVTEQKNWTIQAARVAAFISEERKGRDAVEHLEREKTAY